MKTHLKNILVPGLVILLSSQKKPFHPVPKALEPQDLDFPCQSRQDANFLTPTRFQQVHMKDGFSFSFVELVLGANNLAI